MKKFIIAANLGQVRVLRYREAGEDPIEQKHLVEDPGESHKEHVKTIQDTVTDQPGKFGRGGPAGVSAGMSYGEEHNLEAELERGALRRIASRIDDVLKSEGNPPWVLAAPQNVLARLKKALSPAARHAMTSSVGADLTRCPLPEMEARFL